MKRFLSIIELLFNYFADFLYAPLVRAHIREVALKAPLFPGQIWSLPNLGRIRIMSVSDTVVEYTLMNYDDDTFYICKRSDFFVHARDELEHTDQKNEKFKLLQFPLHEEE